LAFIIRIYHDARSSEYQILGNTHIYDGNTTHDDDNKGYEKNVLYLLQRRNDPKMHV